MERRSTLGLARLVGDRSNLRAAICRGNAQRDRGRFRADDLFCGVVRPCTGQAINVLALPRSKGWGMWTESGPEEASMVQLLVMETVSDHLQAGCKLDDDGVGDLRCGLGCEK